MEGSPSAAGITEDKTDKTGFVHPSHSCYFLLSHFSIQPPLPYCSTLLTFQECFGTSASFSTPTLSFATVFCSLINSVAGLGLESWPEAHSFDDRGPECTHRQAQEYGAEVWEAGW